jgi:2-polyprenyl-3-methyl-5-hydroxy-6-metoxy-1,4-benzoquinol methylase
MSAFDAVAGAYDADFTHSRLGVWLRDTVRDYIPFRADDHILELGCGTGEDALWMGRHEIRVTATDSSSEMLSRARRKIESVGLSSIVSLAQLDMNRISEHTDDDNIRYDGVFSNFGGINCVEDRTKLARYLAERIHSGSKVVLVVMSPYCPWEIFWSLLHGKFSTAFRRFKKGGMAHVGEDQYVRVWYPSPRTLQREFVPYFKRIQTIGVGVLLPPTYLDHLVERYPKLFANFAKMDRWLGRYFPFTWLCDHYLMILERQS